LIFCLVLSLNTQAQIQDLTAVYCRDLEAVSQLLFTPDGSGFEMKDAFRARSADLADVLAGLTVSGDFTGDGADELATFNDLLYTPNMNPDFRLSVVTVKRSNGKQFIPLGSWFSLPEEELNFDNVSFAVAGDYNLDGADDIAIFYNDPMVDQQVIYVLESSGSGFTELQTWYSVDRTQFNFTALKFACPGDFNGNGKPDIAVVYNYFGTDPDTKQAIFLFESEGDSFSLLPVAYDATKVSYDFSEMKFAFPGDYNLDGYSDVVVLHEDPVEQDLILTVFEGSSGGQLSPIGYASFVDSEPSLSHVVHAAGGNFSGDTARDVALFYDNPGTGMQEILVLESGQDSFSGPNIVYSAGLEMLDMSNISSVNSGFFHFETVVSVTTWKDDSKGAISFTFDDGNRGAFEHGGAELELAGLKGTFYIFTDTSSIYDGELASTSLVREYRNKGHEIASHTSNHSNLGLLTETGDMDSLSRVLSTSLELLNERFNQNTMSMSIPFGSFRYETLGYMGQYYYSARSSQFGFNLATPYDFYALKSWPILSTTSPAYVDNLLDIAESYGTYLPLMYHDLLDEPFDEDLLIYTYSRDLFTETVEDALGRDLWIDTHQNIYKYIKERNALKISKLETGDMDSQPGHFSFEADDGLADSIFDMELTLKIAVPEGWIGDTLSIGTEGEFDYAAIQQDSTGNFVLYDWLPDSGVAITINEGILTGRRDSKDQLAAPILLAAPNPFRHETTITVAGRNSSSGFLIVRDLHGRIVKEIRDYSGASIRLSAEKMVPGIYIIQLMDSGRQIASLKLLLQ
jgi:peptidoglycan/xylan/chitin deacetylase (PgdA/CDA1 family)